jgi:hypothetical protein
MDALDMDRNEVTAHTKALHRELFGGESAEQEGEEMRILAARDVIVNRPAEPQPTTPQQPAPEPQRDTSAPKVNKSLAAKALPWLLGAAIPASGAMGALATYFANRPAAIAPAPVGDAANWDVEVSKVGAEP